MGLVRQIVKIDCADNNPMENDDSFVFHLILIQPSRDGSIISSIPAATVQFHGAKTKRIVCVSPISYLAPLTMVH